MRSELEKDLLLKAVDGYKRRLIIVSDDFRILASNYNEDKDEEDGVVGRFCYEFIYNCSEPCRDCIALQTIQQNKSMIRTDYTTFNQGKKNDVVFPILYLKGK